MEEDRLEEILRNLEELTQLGRKLQDELGEEEEEDEIVKSLSEDYNDFFVWALGEKVVRCTRKELIKKWKKTHPDLPIPRIFQTDADIGKELTTICLFMDAYPLYLANED